jgi:phosphomannomutase
MLIRSISGVRGLTKTSLTPELSIVYAKALNKLLPDGVIITGRDSRPSGDLILSTMIDELIRLGRSIVQCDIVPTPTVQFMVHNTEAAGGLVVTASHNPIEWNGFKFIKQDSTFFNPNDCKKLFELADTKIFKSFNRKAGIAWKDKNAVQKHVISCVSLSCISLNKIRERNFKIVIDAVNGAGSDALPSVLDSLGCEVVKINCEPNGIFKRGAEPIPENLKHLSETVVKHKADAGFAIDPDADRLAIVDENGVALGEEYTLVLAADGYIKNTNKSDKKFVINLSTSMALEKLASKIGIDVERSAVGEINVVNKMNDLNSNFGGEGNGGVILRESHMGRDSLVAATLVLNRMAQSNTTLSSIFNTLPQYKIIKDKISIKNLDSNKLIDKVSSLFKDAEKSTIDGIKFIWVDKWIHLRKSNTEPIMRIYSEAKTKKIAWDLVTSVKNLIY